MNVDRARWWAAAQSKHREYYDVAGNLVCDECGTIMRGVKQ